ncbi:MAG: hypothetical protein PF483_03890 [Halothiobacillus sp.]|nr:hypothetical protein [Halothiobacillus sp.]
MINNAQPFQKDMTTPPQKTKKTRGANDNDSHAQCQYDLLSFQSDPAAPLRSPPPIRNRPPLEPHFDLSLLNGNQKILEQSSIKPQLSRQHRVKPEPISRLMVMQTSLDLINARR